LLHTVRLLAICVTVTLALAQPAKWGSATSHLHHYTCPFCKYRPLGRVGEANAGVGTSDTECKQIMPKSLTSLDGTKSAAIQVAAVL